MMGKKEEKIKTRFIQGENLKFGLEPITLWVGCVCVCVSVCVGGDSGKHSTLTNYK